MTPAYLLSLILLESDTLSNLSKTKDNEEMPSPARRVTIDEVRFDTTASYADGMKIIHTWAENV